MTWPGDSRAFLLKTLLASCASSCRSLLRPERPKRSLRMETAMSQIFGLRAAAHFPSVSRHVPVLCRRRELWSYHFPCLFYSGCKSNATAQGSCSQAPSRAGAVEPGSPSPELPDRREPSPVAAPGPESFLTSPCLGGKCLEPPVFPFHLENPDVLC